MSREIKFRAWGEMSERYYQDVQNVYDDDIGDNFQDVLENKCLIVEQYTGINDRVGKPIHENDIVEMDYIRGNHTILDPQTLGMVEQYNDVDTILRGVVHIWPSTGVIINHISSENPEQFVGDYRTPQYLHINKNCIVIGNIHENPERLEADQ